MTGQLEVDDPKIGMEVVGVVDVVRQEAYESFWGFIFHAA